MPGLRDPSSETHLRTILREWVAHYNQGRPHAGLVATLDDAKASLARGEGRIITQQSMRDLAEEVKQRGQVRLRLAAEQSSPR